MRIQNLQEVLGDPMIEPSIQGRQPGQRDAVEMVFARVHRLPRTYAATAMWPNTSQQEFTGSSTTWQLQLALRALNVGEGDEVILPGLSRRSVGEAVLFADAIPVFIDVDPATGTLDPARCEAYLKGCQADGKALPKVIVVVHLDQCPADMDRFVDVCRRYGVFLIEECGHALGGAWNGRALGTFGVMGVFSYEGLRTVVESAIIVTGVPALDERLAVRVGRRSHYPWSGFVWPEEVDELTAYWRARVDELGLEAWESDEDHLHQIPPVSAAALAADLEELLGLKAKRAAVLAKLDRSLREVVGIERLVVPAQVTSLLTQRFAFRFDPAAFAGMDGELFRQVLSYLLAGAGISAPYCPSLARRGQVVAETGWDGLDELDLPVSERLLEQLVVIHDVQMNELLHRPDFPAVLVEAIKWMWGNAQLIVAAAA